MTTLRPIVTKQATTLSRRRREAWSAATVDGLWWFERTEDVGTPWIVLYRPTQQAVLAFPGAIVPAWYGTLKAARMAVERGNLTLARHTTPAEAAS